jgi:hypothetical protein
VQSRRPPNIVTTAGSGTDVAVRELSKLIVPPFLPTVIATCNVTE